MNRRIYINLARWSGSYIEFRYTYVINTDIINEKKTLPIAIFFINRNYSEIV